MENIKSIKEIDFTFEKYIESRNQQNKKIMDLTLYSL